MAQYQTRGSQLDFSAGNTGFGQGLARVVGLRDGGFGVSWIAADADRTMFDADVFGRVYDANLAPTTANPLSLITDTGPSNSYPVNQALTELQGGGFALLSTDDSNYTLAQAANQRDVAVRLFDASGAAIGQPVNLGAASVLGVTVTTLSDGRLVAGWIDVDGALRGQYLSAAGAKIGDSFFIAKPASDFASRPVFSALTDGGWIATYAAQNQSEGHAIFYNAAGQALTDRLVTTNLTNIQGVQVEELADGRAVLVWTVTQSGQPLETHAQIYTAAGDLFGPDVIVSNTASSAVSVTGLADGGFAIALEPSQSGPAEIKVYNSIGQQNGSTISIASAVEPSIASLADGGFVVSWRDSGANAFHAQAYSAVAAGNLTVNGTAGVDTLAGQEGSDVINGLAGNDQLFGSVGNDQLFGGDGNDQLDGGAGNDTLNGGTGADVMAGGAGDDIYFVDNAADTVVELAGAGSDRILSGVSYTLGAGVSVELLTTDFNAGTAALNLTGNELANTIYGNAGSNILNGGGGIDTLVGLAGNDFYFVDNAADRIIETAGQGTDRVLTNVSYTLGTGVSVEVLTTDFNAGTAAINLTGNELANTIYGNAGANILDGKAGADTMLGLGGDDWYFVDNAADRVIEAAGEGNDRILSSVSYTLSAGSSVELLTTDANNGTAAINLTGNELANTIYGNAGNNVLNGGGGADTLVGLSGDDSFFVDNAADRIIESAGQGSDRVLASVSYTLSAGASVELLTTDANNGTAALNLTGNELANTIYGNAGVNVLHGGGGDDTLVGLGGDDQLFGDAGNDQFLFGAGFGHDTIGDFANPGAAVGDTVRFLAGTFSSFNDLMSKGAQQGADAVFTLDANNSVTLHNVQLAALTAQDFIFG